MMKNNSLGIVIPTFNRKDSLNGLLEQLLTQIEYVSISVNIIVVVDGSTDGTIEMLVAEYPEVHIVRGDGNWWYTKSINEGFKYALKECYPDFILTLNDDILIADNFFYELGVLLENCDKNTVYGATSYSNEQPYRIFNGGNFYKDKLLSRYGYYYPFLSEVDIDQMKGSRDTLMLPGRGMLIPTEILKRLNYFDSRFKQYHSDGDFTLRAIKKGFKVKVSYDMVLFVELEETSDSTSYLNRSYKKVLQAFIMPTSRVYLLDLFRITWRHGNRYMFLPRLLLRVILPIINVKRKEKL